MLFGGFSRCLYPLQKFDLDTERRFAVILERDALEVVQSPPRAVPDLLQLGTEQPEYIPDFVAETDSMIRGGDQRSDDLVSDEVKPARPLPLFLLVLCTHRNAARPTVGQQPWRSPAGAARSKSRSATD